MKLKCCCKYIYVAIKFTVFQGIPFQIWKSILALRKIVIVNNTDLKQIYVTHTIVDELSKIYRTDH